MDRRIAAAILAAVVVIACVGAWLIVSDGDDSKDPDAPEPAAVPVTGIAVEGGTVGVGGTLQLTAVVTPSDATDRSVSWSSSDGSVATVSSTGLVTGVSAGTVRITCTASDGSGVSASCEVTVAGSSERYITVASSYSSDTGMLTLSGTCSEQIVNVYVTGEGGYRSNYDAYAVSDGVWSGRFNLGTLGPGTYVVHASSGTALTAQSSFTVSAASDASMASTGLSVEIPTRLMRYGSVTVGVDTPATVYVSDKGVTVDVGDDSIMLYGVTGDLTVSAVFSDGTRSDCSISVSGDSVRMTGKAADGTAIDSSLGSRRMYDSSAGSDWSYWTGNTVSPGVSDAATPISSSSMRELWKVESKVDGGSSVWKTPGSAICVGTRTYYYDGQAETLRCVVTSTGAEVASASCPSKSVYNMALAYGDGKVFVPTRTDGGTVVRAFDATTMQQLFVTAAVPGGEVQGAITYHDGGVFLGTYERCYACFDTADTDTSRSDETVQPRWMLDADGWYNSVPSFFDGFCVVIEKGYDIGGAVAYSVDTDTGAVLDTITFDMEYCVSGSASYAGRVYIPLNAVTDKEHASGDSSDGKTLVIRSYAMNRDGTFDRGSATSWTSPTVNGGTQSIPVIWNGRLYIGGGGGTMGTSEPFDVLDVSEDGGMTLAYTVSDLQTKGTASLTTAYATSADGDRVYIYLIEYGHVFPGEEVTSTNGYAQIYCISDAPGQRSANIVFKVRPSVDQFAYQSFTVSPDGYLLIRNDSTLFCYGDVSRSYTASDLATAIDRIVRMSASGEVNPADVQRAEARYAALSDQERSQVTNYADLRALYRTVTFSLGGSEVDVRVLSGSPAYAPPVDPGEGRALAGWTCDGEAWNLDTDRVTSDITLVAVLADTVAVSFDPAGGSPVSSIDVVPGGIMGYVPEPERDGYVFGGWFSGSAEYIPQHSTVASAMTLTARWLKVSTVSFDSDGGSSADPMAVVQDRAVGALPTVKRTGYTFTGWYYNDVLYTSETVYSYDHGITLKAGWIENSSSTIDNGKGVRVTGIFPEGVTMTFAKMPPITTTSRTMLLQAAGSDAECFVLGIYGDGVDGSQTFRVDLPVGASWNGRTVTVWYYVSGTVSSVSGTVSDGVLPIDITGATSSRGAQITFAVPPGSALSGSQSS